MSWQNDVLALLDTDDYCEVTGREVMEALMEYFETD